MSEFSIRQAQGSDLNFIFSTWLDSYRYDSDIGRACRNSIFFPEYQKIIDNLLAISQRLVVCHRDESNVIFGFLIYQDKYLHYCFIKEAFRHLGLAKALWREAKCPLTYTHRTRSIQSLVKDKSELIYNPFVLYKGV